MSSIDAKVAASPVALLLIRQITLSTNAAFSINFISLYVLSFKIIKKNKYSHASTINTSMLLKMMCDVDMTENGVSLFTVHNFTTTFVLFLYRKKKCPIGLFRR
jgi:hypothetical protein